MKKAFTMIELLFVIVIVGIITAIALPRFDRDNLNEAADQVVNHIRYTQHLAMQDDKFNPNDQFWYKGRWQIHFSQTTGSNNQWAYTIFSDYTGTHTGNPDPIEVARNPADLSKRLTGGYSGTNIIKYDDEEATQKLNLGAHYEISDIDFTGGCNVATNRQRISFDYQGRPLFDNPRNLTNPYISASGNKLIRQRCIISLCLSTCTTATGDEKIQIAIEPETGYTHIL